MEQKLCQPYFKSWFNNYLVVFMELLAYLTEPLHPVVRGIVHSVEILPPEEAGVLGVVSRQVQEELRQQSGLPTESLGHDVDVGPAGSDGGVVRTS